MPHHRRSRFRTASFAAQPSCVALEADRVADPVSVDALEGGPNRRAVVRRRVHDPALCCVGPDRVACNCAKSGRTGILSVRPPTLTHGSWPRLTKR